MSNRKFIKTRERNKNKALKDTGKKGMDTSKMYPDDERINIKIPKNSKIYQFLYGYKTTIKNPIYSQLDLILDIATQTRYDRVEEEFNRFMDTINKLYPEKAHKIEKLRALILWHILDEQELTDYYYEKLKEL